MVAAVECRLPPSLSLSLSLSLSVSLSLSLLSIVVVNNKCVLDVNVDIVSRRALPDISDRAPSHCPQCRRRDALAIVSASLPGVE